MTSLKISHDEYAESPRAWDNLGRMYCKHGRYTLGDDDAEDPMEEFEFVDIDGIKVNLDEFDYIVGCLVDVLELYEEEGPNDLFCNSINIIIENLEALPTEIEAREKEEVAYCLPLYLYDHSGLTISHGSFSCPWDSGQVGWHYVTWHSLNSEYPSLSEDEKIEKAKLQLKAELETYDAYLRGEVYAFMSVDSNGNEDSCSGFYDLESIKDHLSEDVLPLFDEACARIGEEIEG